MWVLLTNRVTLACLLLATGGTAIAQSDAGQAIDFNRAIAKTLASNPELRAFGFEIEAQQGRIRQSALRPAVELGVDIDRNGKLLGNRRRRGDVKPRMGTGTR
jgi:outer membrane protein TolC